MATIWPVLPRIEPLKNKADWGEWSREVKCHFKIYGHWEIVTGERPQPADDATKEAKRQ